jgi:thioredoxin-like negative regulator of GroEL
MPQALVWLLLSLLPAVRSDSPASAEAPSAEAPSAIVALDAAALAEVVGSAPRAGVLFYAPWCKFSRAFLPQFDALPTDSDALRGISLGKLDVTQSDDAAALAKQMQVQSYPALVLFRHGIPTKYSGEYSTEEVTLALRNMGEHLVRRIDTAEHAAAFLADGEGSGLPPRVRVVGADDGTDNGTVAILLALESAAATFDERRVVFGIARSPEAAAVFNLSTSTAAAAAAAGSGEAGSGSLSYIALYKPFEEGRVELSRPVTAGGAAAGMQRLKEWVGAHLRPAMVPLDPTDERQLSGKGETCLVAPILDR